MEAATYIRSLLHALPSIHPTTTTTTTILNNHNHNHHHHFLLFKSKSPLKNLTLKSKPNPSHHHILFASSSFAPFAEQTDQEDEEVETESPPVAEASRLYVGNLSFSMTSSQLADIFNEAGTVKSVDIVYDRVTDRSRGFAFITMANNEDAKNAIRLFDGSLIEGRTVKVNFPEVPRGGEREVMGPRTRASRGYVDSPYKVYCGNLAWILTSESLKNAFAEMPGLIGAKVIYEHDSGRSRGFGFLSFTSLEAAQNAIDTMNGKELEGRALRLNLASERSGSSSTATTAPAS